MNHSSGSCSILNCLVAIGLLVVISCLAESLYVRQWMGTSSSIVLQKNETATTEEEVGLDNDQQSTNNHSSATVEGNSDMPLAKVFRFCTDQVVYFDK